MSRRMAGAKFWWLATAVVAMALPVTDGNPLAQQREQYSLRDREVAIYNLAGRVDVVGGGRSEVLVEVTRGGRDAEQLRIEQGAKGGAEALRIIYPGRQVVYPGMGSGSRTEVSVAPDGTFGSDWKSLFGGQRRIIIRGSGSGTHAWADLKIAVPRGQKLTLHHAVGKVTVENVDGDLLVGTHNGSIVAHNTRGTISLDTGSGGVSLDVAEGDVRIDTGSGNVEVSAVRGPLLHVDTGSGDVNVTEAEVERLHVDTGSGSVRLEAVGAGSVNVDTGSGSVNVDLTRDVESLVADTGSGSVTVTAPASLGAEFDIQTGSGRIDVDFPHESLRVERDHVSGRIGDGRGRIRIDTGSGGVKFHRRITTSSRPASMILGLMSGLPRVG